MNGDFGGHREQLEKKAKNAIPRSYESASVGFSNVKSEYTNKLIERSKQFDNYYTSSRFVSSVPGGTGISSGYGSSVTKSGTLDKNNYDRKDDSKLKHIGGIQQGFCFINDNLCAIVEKDSYREKSSVYLIDLNTMTQTDEIHNLIGHGNTIAYDKKTGDIIFPEDNDTALIHVDISTKKMEKNPKRVHTPADDSASVAYNSQLDMFVSYSYPTSVSAYTREAFYNRGKESVRCSYQKPKARSGSGLGLQGCGSYGNHAYIIYSEMDLRSGNYIIVCNIKTGKAEKVINDDRVNGYPHSDYELEELDFKEDGTMYGIYGGGGINILERSYNYFSDTDIDKSNITPGAGTNSIAAYNTGGVYTEAGTFERVFNMHYKARKNILSVEEWLFEALENNQDTAGMVDLTKYLLYKATGISFGITEFDYEAYGMQGIGVGGATLSITSTTFTREQFVQLTQSYSGALSKGSRTATFRENAGIIYDVCVKNHINPVLCAAQGWKEQNWDDPNTSPFNFWGIAVYNGQNYGKSWGSMEQAVQGYCDQINSQLNGKMKSTYQARAQQFAPVNNKFVGDMSNIYDVFSAYAYIGDGHTLKEQADYAANYVDSLIKCATQIYGEGALTGGNSTGGEFVAVAERLWKKICNGNYSYGGSSIPCTGSTVDCSSYVSWVLYEYGYTEFRGGQHCTQDFKNTNWSAKYGWTEINVGAGQNPYNSIEPGDIFVRDPGNNKGHVTLVVRKENGSIYCFDCGSSDNWRNNPSGEALNKSYMLTDSRPGKIIRVKPKT